MYFDSLQKGDFVIIQPDTMMKTDLLFLYRAINHLSINFEKKIIDDPRTKEQTNHLFFHCSPSFDGNGNLKDTHGNYIELPVKSALETQTCMLTWKHWHGNWLREFGPEKSKSLLCFVIPVNVRIEKWVQGPTHLNFMVQSEVMRLSVKEAKKQKLTLGKLFKMQMN